MNDAHTNSFLLDDAPGIKNFRREGEVFDGPDRRDGRFYRYSPELKLAIRVALAVGRPLLLFGPSGCGKSSLAPNLALLLQRRFYEFVVNSRSEAKDLFYRFDAIRRLGEAQLGSAGLAEGNVDWRNPRTFVEPGPLWWVYNPASATHRGTPEGGNLLRPAKDPGTRPQDDVESSGAVLLLDEIDKADPDFPNNLLVPLGSRQFFVEETGDLIELAKGEAPLVIITSNRERELPSAFIRRCVVLDINPLSSQELIELAQATFDDHSEDFKATLTRISDKLRSIRPYEQVSSAEYLDTVKAIRELHASESHWHDIIMQTSWTAHAPLPST